MAEAEAEASEPGTPAGASPRAVLCRMCEEAVHPDAMARHSQVRVLACMPLSFLALIEYSA